MTTEREYQEWQAKRHKNYQKRQASSANFWLLTLLILSVWVYFSSNKQLVNSELIN